MRKFSKIAVLILIVIMSLTSVFISCVVEEPSDGGDSGGDGASADLTNYYTKTEIDGLIQWAKNVNDIFIKNTGNVGIGTQAPAAKLEVN